MATRRSFKQFVQQKIGKFLSFLIYVILEWILIAILFIDGLIAFAANEFARFFELQIPCLLCTRIDHVLVRRNPDFYYNDSICESHRKDVSSKAYCHVHKRLSDIQQMCEACLLSFATENKPSDDPYKSLVAILGADLEYSVEGDHKHSVDEEEDLLQVEKSSIHRCSCCGEPLRVKATFQQALVRSLTMNRADVPQAPTPSPRAQVTTKNEESRGLDMLPHIRYAELKFVSDTESEIPEDEEGSITSIPDAQLGREDMKAATVPLLTESEDLNEEACKTPSFIRTSRFFGITPTGSATASPRWLARLPRKLLPEKTDSGTEPLDGNSANNIDGDTILHNLKRQVRFDRKSLIALYMELDEERNASAVAANQAMAMITRLQAEKAAIEMEALQYQRMMEEQAEYDQQALQDMKEQLTKREEEIKVLEEEVETYRLRLGCEEILDTDDYQESNHGPVSSISGKSECGSSQPILDEEVEKLERASDQTGPSQIENGLGIVEELTLDLEFERNYLLERLRMLEKTHSSPNDGAHFTLPSSDIIKEEDKGYCSSTSISRQISDVNERLEALETDKEFLKHAVQSLKKGDEGTQLLKEIAQHLRELRHREKPLEVVAV
ncbi:Zein-binding domain [Macleaya cordata]|uniref:Zein-binding domain n=1 Tax=Macleaya cordata TaxID=56857 RepID=A0A200QNE2_MACCD|nr:Zein-binding domain [Macleaya cordata]